MEQPPPPLVEIKKSVEVDEVQNIFSLELLCDAVPQLIDDLKKMSRGDIKKSRKVLLKQVESLRSEVKRVARDYGEFSAERALCNQLIMDLEEIVVTKKILKQKFHKHTKDHFKAIKEQNTPLDGFCVLASGVEEYHAQRQSFEISLEDLILPDHIPKKIVVQQLPCLHQQVPENKLCGFYSYFFMIQLYQNESLLDRPAFKKFFKVCARIMWEKRALTALHKDVPLKQQKVSIKEIDTPEFRYLINQLPDLKDKPFYCLDIKNDSEEQAFRTDPLAYLEDPEKSSTHKSRYAFFYFAQWSSLLCL